MGTLTTLDLPGALAPAAESSWIEARDIHHVAGPAFDLAIPDLALRTGRLTALIGANGSGKSTLLGLLTGTRPLQTGQVRVGGAAAGAASLAQRSRIGTQLQDAGFNPHYRVGNIRGLHRAAYAVSDESVFERFGVPEITGRRYSQLSSGQRQRLHLALALAHRPAMALFDEPTSNLDPLYEARFIEALQDARARDPGFSALFVTHAAAVVDSCDDVLMLINGRVEALADKNDMVADAFGTLGARFDGEAAALDGIEAGLAGAAHVRRVVRRDGRVTVYGSHELRPAVQALALQAELNRFAVWRTGAADILESLKND